MIIAAKQISATVDEKLFDQFERMRRESGLNRSNAVQEAMKLYLKAYVAEKIGEGCRAEAKEGLAVAKAAKRASLKALARNI